MPDQTSAEPPHTLLLYTHAVYALFSAGFIFPPLWIIGALIAYLQRDKAAKTSLSSHIQWQIKTFLWALGGAATLMGLMYFIELLISHAFVSVAYGLTGILYALGLTWLVWLTYRVARGWALLNMRRPAPTP